ncbi:Universal stress protein family protein [Roseibacterium elongatum DSM 19469]|uniref:Universal stress protein family protein n=1 Tax=Roseicyclus elongatus DSM 19469 TaxID=1294273 RepID=W8RPI4_9RHOB|nr:universal stress protein [Roseibacterium elongatum]AHM03074.1 Universal stress protein family protein [Roseibacterium elongatum DSM 19469]
MAYKSILTVLTDDKDVAPVLDAVAPFAAAAEAHLDVLCLGIDRTQTGYYFAGATTLMHDETLAQAQAEATRIEQAARTHLAQSDISWGVEALVAQSASVTPVVARRARFADLVMLPKPYGADLPSDAPVMVESAMFQGNAPVIVLADEKPVSLTPRKIVVAWNESNEAMTAIRRAMPMLVGADLVNICIIAPERHGSETTDPGAELSRMLSRHGVTCEVSLLPQTLPRVSEVLKRHIADQDADLLVMGAYGHSRFREAILGGATRNMLEHCTVPVLMAH